MQKITDLLEFIDASPSSFHAVLSMKKKLSEAGFIQLYSGDKWKLDLGGRYFITKNHSALFAFELGAGDLATHGFKIVCAHSDSPTFKIKPNAEMLTEGACLKLNTEVYGGPIMYTWFDRPLSIAGRVVTKSNNILRPTAHFIDFKKPLLKIPHLAIHLNRAVNDAGNPLSKQKDMLPVIAILNDKLEKNNFLLNIIAKELEISVDDILDFDLTLYEYTNACLLGANEEFISAGRLDDLAMAQAGMMAIIDSSKSQATKVLAVFDNEEVGSGSKQGAASPILRTVLERIALSVGQSQENLYRAIHNSFVISADMAHALHPNYPEKHDPTNHPVMGAGPVIKINANQKYITDADSAAVFKNICTKAGVPCQTFVNHSDMIGGSTLGNLLMHQVEMRGVDVGNPMWGMHSLRETATVVDHLCMTKALTVFYND